MKIKSPPDIRKLWENFIGKNPKEIKTLFETVSGPLAFGKYLHWDALVRRPPPEGLSRDEWWFALKFHRLSLLKEAPLFDAKGNPFKYAVVDPIPERLHKIDLQAGGHIDMPDEIANPDTRDRYLVTSLIQEAITSSQLEGAATTRPVAKEMIRTGRKPSDRSEQMILNNFLTMQRIGELKGESLTRELVFEIHRSITDQTLDDPSAAGRLRRADESVVVFSGGDEIYHVPPPVDQLKDRLEDMCSFANGRIPEEFVHPAIRAIMLHFWLAHDHPFVDGNGRTARALFYWSMLNQGFWLFEFISISQILLNAPSQYSRAFLYTETDDNDLTYFVLYQLKVILRAIKELHEYIERKTRQLREIEKKMRISTMLNPRQRVLIGHALRHPGHVYTIQSHRVSHNIVYQTSRSDLLDLQDRGLLDGLKIGRTFHFTPAKNLEDKLAGLSPRRKRGL